MLSRTAAWAREHGRVPAELQPRLQPKGVQYSTADREGLTRTRVLQLMMRRVMMLLRHVSGAVAEPPKPGEASAVPRATRCQG